MDVRNDGPVAGTEIVQLYVRNVGASVEQPLRRLKGFQRIFLNPGESKTLRFPLGFDQLCFYNAQMQRVIEPTNYTVWIGGSSLASQQSDFLV